MPPPLTRDELLRILSVKARQGHVGACRLLLQQLRQDERTQPADDPFEEFDRLADNRRSRMVD